MTRYFFSSSKKPESGCVKTKKERKGKREIKEKKRKERKNKKLQKKKKKKNKKIRSNDDEEKYSSNVSVVIGVHDCKGCSDQGIDARKVLVEASPSRLW